MDSFFTKKVVLSKSDITKALKQYAGLTTADVEFIFIDDTSSKRKRTKKVSLDGAILTQYE
jgi:hypothetical protein